MKIISCKNGWCEEESIIHSVRIDILGESENRVQGFIGGVGGGWLNRIYSSLCFGLPVSDVTLLILIYCVIRLLENGNTIV